jgi:hypothetical protein
MKDNTSVYINNEEKDSYFGQYEFIRNNPGLAILLQIAGFLLVLQFPLPIKLTVMISLK